MIWVLKQDRAYRVKVRSAFFFDILCKQIMEWMNEW